MRRITRLILFLVLLVLSNCSLDDSILNHCTIEGTIKNTAGETLQGVTIELVTVDGTRSVLTDQSGKYQLNDIPYGLVILNYSYGEYYSVKRRLTLNNTEPITIDLILRRFLDEYFLSCSIEYISLQNIDKTAHFDVSTNAGFMVECEASWLTITPKQSFGSDKVRLSFTQNNDPVLREAEIIIIGDYGIEKRITVTQQPGPVLGSEGTDNPGYLPTVNREGILLHFNRAVEVINVCKKDDKNPIQIEHELLNNGLTVKLCGFKQPIHKTVVYTLTVKSTDGLTITTDFQIHSYLKKYRTNYWYDMLYLPGDEVYWKKGEEYSLHQVEDDRKLSVLPDKHTYSHIAFTADKIICFRKKYNGEFFADTYQNHTGKLLSEKRIELNEEYSLSGVSVLNNGIALLHCGSALFLMDTNQPTLQPIQLNTEGIEEPNMWSNLPNSIISAGGGNSFYLYHHYDSSNEKTIYRIDASTRQINKIELPGNYWSVSRGLQSPYLVFSWGDRLLLINTENQSQITIPTSTKFSRINLIEKEGTVPYLILSTEYNLYIADTTTKQLYQLGEENVYLKIASESYSGTYQIIYISSTGDYYVFETDLLISATIQP
ncbi:MAG: carboxypeptidase regulatory-like domain-containing protein [Bacteroides sp.]|nr:carboxypeptidase regulatory-like domain-containing protein [Bacteroides sp.]